MKQRAVELYIKCVSQRMVGVKGELRCSSERYKLKEACR